MFRLKFPQMLLSLLVLALTGLVATVSADVPSLMNYQGRLTDVAGNPVPDGAHDVTFKIYAAPDFNIEIWIESHTVVTTDGFFSVLLGSNTYPLTYSTFWSSELWLGVTVGSDPEMIPLTRIVTSPYAFRVGTVQGAAGGVIQDFLVVEGDVWVGTPDIDGQLIMYTDVPGDESVQLPDSSIHSAEILDEPGLASEVSSAYVSLTPGMTDIETVSITTPSDGYILVQGDCYVQTDGATSDNHIRCQIDEEEGGDVVVPYFTQVGQWAYHSTVAHSYAISAHRIYYKPAGNYTFRLEGEATSTAHTTNAINATVTALFIPTGYESVKSYVSDPAGFDNAAPIEVAADNNSASTETAYEVDLRELEVKALRERAEALKAERDLYEAQLQQRSAEKHD